MRRYRIITQTIFLVLFLFLFVFTKSDAENGTFADISVVFYIDPLILLSNLISYHNLNILFLFSLITVALTFATGRSFCGWVCPLGTLNDITGRLKKREKELVKKENLKIKYYILIFLIVLAVFGVNLAGFLDPLSLLVRSFTIIFYPLFNLLIHSVYDIFVAIAPNSESLPNIYSFLRTYLIENHRVYFSQSIFIGALFLLVLFSNLISKRFWCRYICPLGALLGLMGRYSLLKREIKPCNDCGICEVNCNGGAVSPKTDKENGSECILCMNCSSLCPEESVNFVFSKKPANRGIDIGKRQLFISAGTAVISYPLFKSSLSASPNFHNPLLIRPPGSVREDLFVKKCIKCGACLKVCITNGLQPTLFEAGLEGMWTPHLVPRVGHCEYNCNLCSTVCPTGAIRPITISEKVKTKIGTAHINKNRCIVYKEGKGCLVCEEVCPVPEKAIKIENIQVQINNNIRNLKAPRVVSSLCIGCGICEKNCPVVDSPAIYVTSVGEKRSEENQELLEQI